jgi:tetratricopeptide (TPR) repeat protein
MSSSFLPVDVDPLSIGGEGDPAAPPPDGSATPPPPSHASPAEEFLGRPVPPREHSEFSVPQTPEGVRSLAQAGAWRGVSSLCERLLSSSHPVDVLLTLRWYRIVALIKLRDLPKAEREMTMLGDLRSTSWQYERYPGVYAGMKGTMVPFALLILHAMLPSYLGNHDHALARLYALLSHETAAVGSDGSQRLAERAQTVLAIVNVLCAVHDYPNAVAHLEQLVGALQSQPGGGVAAGAAAEGSVTYDPAAGAGSGKLALPNVAPLLSLLVRLHLQLGNLTAAEDAFRRLEGLVANADGSSLVRLHRGMLLMGSSQYAAALAEFEAALAIEPNSPLAANNVAVCQLYCCRLNDAVGTLQDQLKRDPHANMHEVLVSNLANLYQMTSPTSGGSNKQALERLVMAVAGDDFDESVLNLGQ